MDVAGAKVLLTGANGGIGQAIARALAAKGAELVLSGRRADALEPVARDLGAATIIADLSDRSEIDRLVKEAGKVDVLVANAAIPSSGEYLDYTTEQIDRALDINLRAAMMMAHALAPAMVEAGRGHIVMVGSVAGRAASPGTSLYNATKFGLRGFSLGFRQDLRGTGVGVSLIEPGFVRDAGMFADTGAQAPGHARTVSPEQVGAATVRAIERNRGEVVVAPVELRVGGVLGGAFPRLAELTQRSMLRDARVRQMIEAQRGKR